MTDDLVEYLGKVSKLTLDELLIALRWLSHNSRLPSLPFAIMEVDPGISKVVAYNLAHRFVEAGYVSHNGVRGRKSEWTLYLEILPELPKSQAPLSRQELVSFADLLRAREDAARTAVQLGNDQERIRLMVEELLRKLK